MTAEMEESSFMDAALPFSVRLEKPLEAEPLAR